jgi:hypothetical protein
MLGKGANTPPPEFIEYVKKMEMKEGREFKPYSLKEKRPDYNGWGQYSLILSVGIFIGFLIGIYYA